MNRNGQKYTLFQPLKPNIPGAPRTGLPGYQGHDQHPESFESPQCSKFTRSRCLATMASFERFSRRWTRKKSCLLVGLMSNVAAFVEVNHFFRDVLGMVGDSLQALRDNHEIETPRNRVRTFGHAERQGPVKIMIHGVDFSIPR